MLSSLLRRMKNVHTRRKTPEYCFAMFNSLTEKELLWDFSHNLKRYQFIVESVTALGRIERTLIGT